MFSKILVPTDGSDSAKKAELLAADLAEKYGAKIVLLHVLRRDHIPEGIIRAAEVERVGDTAAAAAADDGFPKRVGEMFRSGVDLSAFEVKIPQAVLKWVGESLLGEAEKKVRARGVKDVSHLVRDGDPARQILEVAKTEAVDLIVMGSTGRGALKGLLMGSVVHKVNQLAPCTCVAVK